MITPAWRSYTAQSVVKGIDRFAETDPTLIARQARRSTAKMVSGNFGREIMNTDGGDVNSLMQVTPSKINLLA